MEQSSRYSIVANDDILRIILFNVNDLMTLKNLAGVNRRFRRIALEILPEVLRLKFCAVLERLSDAQDQFDSKVAQLNYSGPGYSSYETRKVARANSQKVLKAFGERMGFKGTDLIQLGQEVQEKHRALLEIFNKELPLVQVSTKDRVEFVPMFGHVTLASFEESSIAHAFCMANGLQELAYFAEGQSPGIFSRSLFMLHKLFRQIHF